MKRETMEWLDQLRVQANDPGTVFVAVRSRAGSFLVYPEDVIGKSDEQLLTLIRERLTKPPRAGH